MEFNEIINKNRSYRRFNQEHNVPRSLLLDLVNYARLSPSAQNLQPLKYILSNDEEKNNRIFPFITWAGYLKDWDGPVDGERPPAYIIILGDKEISSQVKWDHSIVAQSMLLGAVDKGLGGCMIGAINREGLMKSLKIPERFEIMLILAIGKPVENIIIDEVDPDGNIKYWRDRDSVHHVPKRSLDDLILDL